MITLFENYKSKGRFYYSLKIEEDYFIKQLEKIDCPKKIIEILVNDLKRHKYHDNEINTIFVGIKNDFFSPRISTPTWMLSISGVKFTEDNYEYKGLVRLSKEEREKIELNRAIKNYNL
jgi:hypothetical protein